MDAVKGLGVALIGLGFLALSGCTGEDGSGVYSKTGRAGGTHTVVAGDSLWKIARNHGVSLQSLIDANRIPAPYVLQTGQVVQIPDANLAAAAPTPSSAPILGSSYSVRPGDTLYAISRRSGRPAAALAEHNGLEPPYALQVGQRLTLPEAPLASGQPAAAPVVPAPPDALADGQPADLLSTTSLDNRAPTSGVAMSEVAAGAAVTAVPARITPVQTDAAGSAAVQEAEENEPEENGIAEAGGRPGPLTVPRTKPDLAATIPIAAPPNSEPLNASAPLPDPPRRQGRLFDWPLTGKVISNYGAKKGGLHNDGINIAAPAGTPVRAAESGVVAYTGGDLKGFGKLVLIEHRDGYVTAYAHNSQVLVQRGETVRRGDVIARVGETGSVDTPQLHFEIRKDAKPVDPGGLMVAVAG
ncbi:MAG: LysM peptidoglycan-binding domain-containing M23 family metallopeptidase [Rhodospirillales bacterium]|nr:LysM peptidoglycan-binding domain-containing M23 family metallopeptidase [Rhodospirillales bacterium]